MVYTSIYGNSSSAGYVKRNIHLKQKQKYSYTNLVKIKSHNFKNQLFSQPTYSTKINAFNYTSKSKSIRQQQQYRSNSSTKIERINKISIMEHSNKSKQKEIRQIERQKKIMMIKANQQYQKQLKKIQLKKIQQKQNILITPTSFNIEARQSYKTKFLKQKYSFDNYHRSLSPKQQKIDYKNIMEYKFNSIYKNKDYKKSNNNFINKIDNIYGQPIQHSYPIYQSFNNINPINNILLKPNYQYKYALQKVIQDQGNKISLKNQDKSQHKKNMNKILVQPKSIHIKQKENKSVIDEIKFHSKVGKKFIVQLTQKMK